MPTHQTTASLTGLALVKYIDIDSLKSIDPKAFRATYPFPWINPQGFLTEQGFKELTETMPDVALFESRFGYQRKNNQTGHSRYSLEYEDDLDISPAWEAFIAELLSPEYRKLVHQLVGKKHIRLRMHWHYTPSGCDVSPHCDSKIKLGSQIFYMNTHDDWDSTWGGQTVILDDHGKFPPKSNPGFDDFDQEWGAETMDNRSIIFGRKGNSWHGVKAINAPEGKLRKVFILVYEDAHPLKLLRKRLKRLLLGQSTNIKAERKQRS
jgi:hypothetical protein